ncbi:MAG: S8 family serine peptidase [candidate division Zixibacteria bacterium]|nr:S8 family serine peptidase [candidate division Zixibacteria bacterium]
MSSLRRIVIAVLLWIVVPVILVAAEMPQSTLNPNQSLQKRVVPEKPADVKISGKALARNVVVKFKENTGIRLNAGRLSSKSGIALEDINDLLLPYKSAGLKRTFSRKSESAYDRMKTELELASGKQLADLNLYYSIPVTDPSEAENLINRLNSFEAVEIAYLEPVPFEAVDVDPPTPNYEGDQDYLLAAPSGVDHYYAKTQPGGDGAGVKIIDIELAWTEDHEDLEKAIGGTIVGDDPVGAHGTAVIGVMIAGDNGYGVTGICPGADIGMISVNDISIEEAILIAVDNLERGDIILIEIHSPGPHYNFEYRQDQLGYICVEYWQGNYDAMLYAWAKGLIVVEAGGNGAENFDNTGIYGQLFDTTYRNSHAIIVGAGAPPDGEYGVDRSRLSFSNYGERVNLQGFGQNVVTTGYGDLFDGGDDPNQYYTATFSGTSSASPIVTGAVACLQGYYKAAHGVPLTVDYARDVLNATGSPQQGDLSRHIGPRPALQAAFAALAPPPSLYTEPISIDTSLEINTVAYVPLWLYNRSATSGVDFSFDKDTLAKSAGADWISALPSSGTVPAGDSLEITVTLDATLLEAGFTANTAIFTIHWGPSGASLDSSAFVPVYLEVPCAPDETFAISDSDDIGGPVYAWTDISAIGTRIPDYWFHNSFISGTELDDGTAGPIILPFDIPYYDSTYDRIYVGVNGALSFTDADVNINGYYTRGIDIPGNPFVSLVAPYWNDFVIGDGYAAHGCIYYYHAPTDDTTIIQWHQVGVWGDVNDTLTTFQAILTRTGNIFFQYLDVGASGDDSLTLIGVSGEGCQGALYFDTGEPVGNAIGNGVAVFFDQGHVLLQSGDIDTSGAFNLIDILLLIDYVYGDPPGAAPDPLAVGDVNCDDAINLLDILYLISTIYQEGDEPCYFVY